MKTVVEMQRRRLLQAHPHLAPLASQLSLAVQNAEVETECVSMVITCKNKLSTLEPVLRRIAEQTRRPDWVVLADDASTDQSVPTFIELCRSHGLPWKLAALPAGGNYRLNTIRNKGFGMSPEGLVVLIDGDLILSPIYIERHLALHRAAVQPIGTMGPRFEYANETRDGPVNFMWGNGAEQQTLGGDGHLPAWQRAHGAMCLPRSIWQAVGGFDEGYNGKYGIDDLDFLFRLFLAQVYPVSDFEAYCIHIPHRTTFDGGGRDPHGNVDYFCSKYGVGEEVLGDPLDYSPLTRRRRNWAEDFAGFMSRLNA